MLIQHVSEITVRKSGKDQKPICKYKWSNTSYENTFILFFFTFSGESCSADSLNLKYHINNFAIHFLITGFP